MEEIIKMLVEKFKSQLTGDFVIVYDMISKDEKKNAWITWMKQGIKFAEWEMSLSYFRNTDNETECIKQYIEFLKN